MFQTQAVVVCKQQMWCFVNSFHSRPRVRGGPAVGGGSSQVAGGFVCAHDVSQALVGLQAFPVELPGRLRLHPHILTGRPFEQSRWSRVPPPMTCLDAPFQ